MRAVDALPYLRAKDELRKNLAETDCNAVFQNGTVVPVFIRDGGSQLYIEQDYFFSDPEKTQGFVRFVRKTEAQSPVTPPAVSTKLQGSTTAELVQDAEAKARAAISERYANRQGQNSVPTGNSAFAEAAHRERQAVAGMKGRRNY